MIPIVRTSFRKLGLTGTRQGDYVPAQDNTSHYYQQEVAQNYPPHYQQEVPRSHEDYLPCPSSQILCEWNDPHPSRERKTSCSPPIFLESPPHVIVPCPRSLFPVASICSPPGLWIPPAGCISVKS